LRDLKEKFLSALFDLFLGMVLLGPIWIVIATSFNPFLGVCLLVIWSLFMFYWTKPLEEVK